MLSLRNGRCRAVLCVGGLMVSLGLMACWIGSHYLQAAYNSPRALFALGNGNLDYWPPDDSPASYDHNGWYFSRHLDYEDVQPRRVALGGIAVLLFVPSLLGLVRLSPNREWQPRPVMWKVQAIGACLFVLSAAAWAWSQWRIATVTTPAFGGLLTTGEARFYWRPRAPADPAISSTVAWAARVHQPYPRSCPSCEEGFYFYLQPFDHRAAVNLMWLSALGASLALGARWYRLATRGRGLCRWCGYDLRDNVSGRCPECGRPVGAPQGGRDQN